MERRAQHQQTKVNKTKQATRQEEIILTRLQTGHTRFNKIVVSVAIPSLSNVHHISLLFVPFTLTYDPPFAYLIRDESVDVLKALNIYNTI